MTLEIEISKDGNAWIALYGINLQEGIAAFGDTPAEALASLAADQTMKAVLNSVP